MRVHQLLPVFTPHDAMGQAAVAFRRALRHVGFTGEIYANEVAPAYESLVRPLSHLRPAPDDWVLYHHGIGSSLSSQLLHVPARRGVVFHNITPARYYAGTRLYDALVAGRSQLAMMAGFVDVSIGVSNFNAQELREAGHRNVHVAPLYVEPRRFRATSADLPMLRRLRDLGSPVVLSVARVVPHKRIDDLLSLHAELLRIAPKAQLVVVGAGAAGHASTRALHARARELGRVTFLGNVSHAELVAAYRAADVYVSMSEHEGFGVPLVEAMACDVPVFAFGSAAVPETMGGHGIVFDEKHFAGLAEAIMAVQADAALRSKIVEGQRERLAAFSLSATSAALKQALSTAEPVRAPSKRKRARVAFVVQRFGEHIVGGAEAHARQVAHAISKDVDVEVLTTCADDHLTWANVMPEGSSRDGRLTVHRFRTVRTRNIRSFNRLSKTVFGRAQPLVAEEHWVGEQGPLAPGLVEAVKDPRFDAVAFFTYLYAPTVWGVPLVKAKAIVVPTAHDEPAFNFELYADVVESCRKLLCNTPEEAALIRRKFPRAAPSSIVGVGVEAPKTKPARFREKYGLHDPYLLYVGRLEQGKGVHQLLDAHAALTARFHDAPKLVLAGSGTLPKVGARVRVLGRIDETDKWDGLAGALAVVVPSKFESLSLLALEAMAVGAPVIGNGASDVVTGQLQRSGAGVTYRTVDDFIEAVRLVGAERETLSAAGLRFAEQYRWKNVCAAWLEAIEAVRKGSS